MHTRSRYPRRILLHRILGTLSLAATALLPVALQAQEKAGTFPDRMIQITVPFPAGAATDYAARSIGQSLAGVLGVPVVVENKTGASGAIAADAVAAAPADGYHLMLGTVSLITHPALNGRPPYVPTQLVPLGVAVDMLLVLVARQDLPASDLRGMVAASAAVQGGLNAASPGAGTLSHLGWEILQADTGTTFNHVPYRGSAPAMTDLVAGHADVMIESLASARPHLAGGKIKALAALTPSRLPGLPDTATAREQDYAALEFSAWNVFMVPAGTPPAIVQTLHDALAKAIQQPEVAANLRERGLEPVVRSPAEYLDFMQREGQRWGQVIQQAGVKP